MRILFDEGGFREPHGGVSRYFAEIMKCLPDCGCEPVLPLLSTGNACLHEPPFSLPPHRMTVHDFVRQYCGGRYFLGVGYLYRALARLFPCALPSGELANARAIAFAAGCPALLSNASCFPEIAGDVAVYFDLFDAADLREKLSSVLAFTSAERAACVESGRVRLERYSREKTAATAAVYRRVAG